MANGHIALLTLAVVSAAVVLGIGSRDAEASAMKVRVAAVSFVPTKFDLHGNADRLEQAFRQAKRGGARIAVAPEGALDGYVVNEIIAGDFPPEKMREVAIPLDHPIIQRFQRLATELEMSLVFGWPSGLRTKCITAPSSSTMRVSFAASITRCSLLKATTRTGGTTAWDAAAVLSTRRLAGPAPAPRAPIEERICRRVVLRTGNRMGLHGGGCQPAAPVVSKRYSMKCLPD